jgi:hypothetical protein
MHTYNSQAGKLGVGIACDNATYQNLKNGYPALGEAQLAYVRTICQSYVFTCEQAAYFIGKNAFEKAEMIRCFIGHVSDPRNASNAIDVGSDDEASEAVDQVVASKPGRVLQWAPHQIEQGCHRSEEAMSRVLGQLRIAGAQFDKKIEIIRMECEEHPSPPFNADQLGLLLDFVPFSDDAVKVIEYFTGPQIVYPMTSATMAGILDKWLGGEEKLKMLALLKRFISDPNNKHLLLPAFKFSDEKAQAEVILRDVSIAALIQRQEAQRAAMENAEEKKRQAALKRVGTCPSGYAWRQVKGGYRCRAGGHYVSDQKLAAAMK